MPVSQPLKTTYAELCSPPPGADAVWNRNRGYRFETLLANLLRADNLDPRTSYKAPGEQIDGSFFLDGTVFLLEAKWHATEIPASTLYQFKGKVDGKLSGTIGVFISMSGYSKDAVDALTLGKSLNLVLFDKRDVDAAITRNLGFREVLKRKLRKAAEEGVVYFPTEADVVTVADTKQVDIEALGFDSVSGSVFSRITPVSDDSDLIVLCEGDSDRALIAHFAKRILANTNSTKRIKILVSMGKYSIPKVANAVRANLSPTSKMLIVVDGDGEPAKTLEMLQKGIEADGWIAAIPDPEIETWVGLDRKNLQRSGARTRALLSLEAADSVDIEQLRLTNSAFALFHKAISET